MSKITNFAEANAALQAYWPAKATVLHRQTLEVMYELLGHVGNPQERLRIVHVAGTSGKTSTAYYAAALLHAAGKKVGLTVSPHVDELNERVQINMMPLAEESFCAELSEFLQLVEQSGLQPSYFEVFIAFAFWEFARRQVDYAVVEVGLGGLLDSTNVTTRPDKVCLLTDIGMDHMSVLGDTISEIAAHKAGIIQLHNAAFCYRQDAAVMDVFKAAAKQKQADLHSLEQPPVAAQLDFLPPFQQRNFGLSLTAVEFVLARDHEQAPLSHNALLLAAHTVVPARMEVLHIGDKTVIVDGSHNGQKLHALAEGIRAKFPGKQVTALTSFASGSGRERRLEDGVHELTFLAKHLIITTFAAGQDTPIASFAPEDVAAECERQGYKSFEIVVDAEEATRVLLARPEPVLVVAGSFYLLNRIRPLLLKLASRSSQ